jgi:enamine deaminase RidA (YjgF/YER057c/UK114 family)
MVEHGDLVYLAGITADDTSLSVKEQTAQIIATIDRLLAAAGTDKSRILTALVYVTDMADKPAMNEVWREWMDPENPPARACVGVALDGATLVEIMVTAAK